MTPIKLRNKRKTMFLKMLYKNFKLLNWIDLDGETLAFRFTFCAIESITVREPEHKKLANKLYKRYIKRCMYE